MSQTIDRRARLQNIGKAPAGKAGASLLGRQTFAQQPLTSMRPAPVNRKFRSEAVDAFPVQTAALIPDPTLRALFLNCFPNTLDTTVEPGSFNGHPDTAVLTGDIAAIGKLAHTNPHLLEA